LLSFFRLPLRELNAEIVANAAKIQTALRLSLQDQNSITLLKKEIDKAWKMVDGAQEKEKRARETIQRLKAEITNLSRLVDQGAGLSIGQENAVNELLKVKEDLTHELDAANLNIEASNKRLAEMIARAEGLEAKKGDLEKEILQFKEKLSKSNAEAQREMRISSRLQQEMLTIKAVNDRRKEDLAELKVKHDDVSEKFKDTDAKLQKANSTLVSYQKVAESLRAKNQALEKTVTDKTDTVEELKMDQEKTREELKTISLELEEKKAMVKSQEKQNKKLVREVETIRDKKNEAERYRNWLKDEMKNVLKSVEAQRKDAETDEKLIKDLQTQIKRLSGSLHLAAERNLAQMNLVDEREQVKVTMEAEIAGHKTEEQKLRKSNYVLEKQREKSTVNASQWHAKHEEANEVIKLRDMEISELNKTIQEERNKLKLQQNMYEQVRSDRNQFSKQQVQAEDEIAEMKRKFTIMTHQIDQLKEEIQTKNAALINVDFAFKRLQDEMKVSKRKLNKRKELLSQADSMLAAQDTEIKNLRRTMVEAEAAQHQQKRVYDDVVQERDILGTQLIRRNDELALLYEKIRIQQSTLQKGEMQYRFRLQDLRRLKLETSNLKRLLQIRNQEVMNIEALKNEVYHVQRELLQERIKVKALSEELENPLNVHRWRKLEGSDPKSFELLQKIQTLQKRLIQKTEQVVEKDLLLQEKEKLYVELKNLLARQPGPEVAEQLSIYQHNLKEKTRTMKAMAAELNMFQAQINEYRYEVERLTRELQDVKRKFFEMKRKDQQMKETVRAEQSHVTDPLYQQQMQFHAAQPKITGGGFNLHSKPSA
jgi:chromosome segregation ATPase